jgi:hypothetical protein
LVKGQWGENSLAYNSYSKISVNCIKYFPFVATVAFKATHGNERQNQKLIKTGLLAKEVISK